MSARAGSPISASTSANPTESPATSIIAGPPMYQPTRSCSRVHSRASVVFPYPAGARSSVIRAPASSRSLVSLGRLMMTCVLGWSLTVVPSCIAPASLPHAGVVVPWPVLPCLLILDDRLTGGKGAPRPAAKDRTRFAVSPLRRPQPALRLVQLAQLDRPPPLGQHPVPILRVDRVEPAEPQGQGTPCRVPS